jgi:hypothetical protein
MTKFCGHPTGEIEEYKNTCSSACATCMHLRVVLHDFYNILNKLNHATHQNIPRYEMKG